MLLNVFAAPSYIAECSGISREILRNNTIFSLTKINAAMALAAASLNAQSFLLLLSAKS